MDMGEYKEIERIQSTIRKINQAISEWEYSIKGRGNLWFKKPSDQDWYQTGEKFPVTYTYCEKCDKNFNTFRSSMVRDLKIRKAKLEQQFEELVNEN